MKRCTLICATLLLVASSGNAEPPKTTWSEFLASVCNEFWIRYQYQAQIEAIDWVAYYKSGSNIQSGFASQGNNRIQFAPMFVFSPTMQWAAPYPPGFVSPEMQWTVPQNTPVAAPRSDNNPAAR
jgi:hypothetical protein